MQWYENESFWEDTFPVMFREPLWERATREVEHILRVVGHRGGPVLDLCCGPGRHLIPIAARGIRATGVDMSAPLLAKARELADAQGLDVELVREDVRTFVRPAAFELTLSMFTSFGYFEDHDENLTVLRNMRSCLVPGGAAVVDILGKEIWSKMYHANDFDGPNGIQLRVDWEACDDWSRIRNRWTVRQGEHVREHVFFHTLYSGFELKELMRAAGFEDVRLYGSYDGAPYDHEATRLIAVGVVR